MEGCEWEMEGHGKAGVQNFVTASIGEIIRGKGGELGGRRRQTFMVSKLAVEPRGIGDVFTTAFAFGPSKQMQ